MSRAVFPLTFDGVHSFLSGFLARATYERGGVMDAVTMGKPRVYLAGRMRGERWYNFAEFDKSRDKLIGYGWDVVSPADIDRAHGFDPFRLPADFDWETLPAGLDLDEIMLRDLDALETCDAIYMLSGWEKSSGANQELAHANRLGMRVFYQDRENCGESHYPSALVMEPPVMAPVATACQLQNPKCGEVRVTDPVTGGQKGSKPAAFALIPAEPLWELATLYGYGSQKYSADNWRKGYSWRLSFSACMRHLWAFWRGEDIDPESGVKHVVHAAWHCLTMAWFMDFRRGHDDRSKSESLGQTVPCSLTERTRQQDVGAMRSRQACHPDTGGRGHAERAGLDHPRVASLVDAVLG